MKPKIVLSSVDAERLENLIDSLTDGVFPGKKNLEDELARADGSKRDSCDGGDYEFNCEI